MFDRFVLWLASTGFTWLLVIGASFVKRRRMSHNNGTTGAGTITVVDAPTFPAHPFFTPGRVFKARLRHASVSYQDDTVTQVRSASLKFADSDYESPLDIEMNTGLTSLFWSGSNFFEFFKLNGRVDDCDFVPFYQKYPQGLRAAREGIRKYPETFAQMYYYSQCAQRFVGSDGVLRYVKYRLIPDDRGPETGLMKPDEMTGFWKERVEPGETRSPNYLKREFAERVAKGPVRYHLQLQLHTPTPGESDEVMNCNVAWDEAAHPWMDLATVVVDRALSLRESSEMRFTVNHAPPSLGNLPARSLDDYNSVVYMRGKTGLAKSSRLLAYRIFGWPVDPPEDRVNAPEH